MKVGLIILNYNGWQDTIACVESVLLSTVLPAWIIIVDNASTDDSVRMLRRWANVDLYTGPHKDDSSAFCSKPLQMYEIDNDEIPHTPPSEEKYIILVQKNQNKGYATGNNAGIRLLMQWGADAVLILNNDTVVDKHALKAMQNRLFAKQRPGLCGPLLRYMKNGGLVQCRGGGLTNQWTGLSVLDGYKFSVEKALLDPPEAVERRINFIYGACVMASRTFIETVGLLDERYFLYCEEQDWAYGADGRFDLAYAPDAVVYHKEGGTTGFSSHTVNLRSLYHLAVSRILLTVKHKPWALPTVGLCIVFAALRMVCRRVSRLFR